MGYTTEFYGRLRLNKPVNDETKWILDNLNQTRRMKRNAGPEFGVEGEFYFGIDGNVIDRNNPPNTQPGLWCQWCLTEDRQSIVWDGGESMKLIKFKDGTFGIRRRYFIFYQYLSFKNEYWWKRDERRIDKFISDCRADEDAARKVFETLTDKGEVVK